MLNTEKYYINISRFLRRFIFSRNILFLIVCSIIIVTFFNGYFEYGLHFDKVNRVNNIIKYINPEANPVYQTISSIHIFGKEIPLMYKSYISSVTDLRYFPLYFFSDYNFGLKLLDLIFFVLTIFLSFLIVRRYTDYAYVFALLLLLNPILYPQILFGFIYNMHVLLFIFASHLLYQYYKNYPSSRWLLFGGYFILFFSCNFFIYNAWILIACFIISILFFRKQLLFSFSNFKDIRIIILAFFLGLFNYLIYNIKQGFPTLQPFFLRLLSREKYNENPIDSKLAKPFFEDIAHKLTEIVPSFYREYFALVIVGFLLILAAYILILAIILKRKITNEYKYYFIPVIGFVIVFILVLLSPKTFRAGHYIHLSPFLELSIICIILLYNKVFPLKLVKRVSGVLILVFIIFNIIVSYSLVKRVYSNKGSYHFTPAIYSLNNYLNSNHIDGNNVVHTEWGLYSQLYFLNKGEFEINDIFYGLLNKKEPELSEIVKERLVMVISKIPTDTVLYLPIYSKNNNYKHISNSLLKIVNELGGKAIKEKVFYEKDGKEVIYLYSITGIRVYEVKSKIN